MTRCEAATREHCRTFAAAGGCGARGRDWAPPAAQIRTWASAALGRRAAGAELAVRVVEPAESKRLNARYRGRDKPTNVLSFPVPELPATAAAAPAHRGRSGIW